MPKSMTAFGRGQAPAGQGYWMVEVRCLNSRYLDPHLRLPPNLAGLEERIKKYLARHISRGRVQLSLRAAGMTPATPRLVLNRPLVQEYRRVLEELRAELGLEEDPGLAPFLANRDLILVEEETPDLDALWSELEPALARALEQVEAMRAAEGANLAQDMADRLERLRELFAKVAQAAPAVVEAYRAKLAERIAQLTGQTQPDPQRLAMEVAIIADKCDVAEEVVRAQSHLDQFAAFLQADEPVGRRLDFLIQELNREANTMASKLPDATAAQTVVEIKAELERLREQVQNIE